MGGIFPETVLVASQDERAARKRAVSEIGSLSGARLVYVSALDPAPELEKFLASEGISNAKIIDCVSKEGLGYSEENYRVRVRGFSNLTTLAISIGEESETAIVIDNLNRFFLYNGREVFEAFVFSLIARMKLRSCRLILACAETEGFSEEISAIASFCDRKVDA